MVLWGANYPGVKFALHDIPFLSFNFLRLTLMTAILGTLWLRRVPRNAWAPLANAGIALTVVQLFIMAGVNYSTASETAILFATSPILSAGWLALLRRDHLDIRRWLGLVVGLTGVGLVVSGAGGTLDPSHTIGDLSALASAASWVWFSLALSPVVGSIGMWQATGWTSGIAAFLFLPFALFESGRRIWWSTVSREAWAALLGTAVIAVVAFALWGKSMHRLGPRQTMVYAYLEPVSAVVIAAILLKESLSMIQAAGAFLAFIGVWLASDSEMISK